MEDYVYFGSSSRLPILSNFAHITLSVTPLNLPPLLKTRCPALVKALEHSPTRALSFASLEHLYQGTKACDEATLLRFTTSGDLGSWNPTIFDRTLVPKSIKNLDERANAALKKMNYWRKKKCIGILAKLAANPKHGRVLQLGTQKMNYNMEILEPEDEQALWVAILKLKYTQNPSALEALLSTGDTLLIEFDKSARRTHVHWGGLYDELTCTVLGDNVMGNYLTLVRKELAVDI